VSPAIPCPQAEEFSALLDWELAPARLPALERHIEECEKCRAHYRRLAAADRMLGLTLGEAKVLAECLAAQAGEKDALSPALQTELEDAGREEWLAAMRDIARQKAAGRKRLAITLAIVLVVVVGGFVALLHPPPVAEAGGAELRGGYVIAGDAGGKVSLDGGAKVRLAPGTVVGFRATWRWDDPWAELVRGRLDLDEGELTVLIGGKSKELTKGQSIEVPGASGPPAPSVPPGPSN
jgi:anti-sigma factor RsiW